MLKKSLFTLAAGLLIAVFLPETGNCKKPSDYLKNRQIKEYKTISYVFTVLYEGEQPMKMEYYRDKGKECFIVKNKEKGKYKTQTMVIYGKDAVYMVMPDQKMAMKMSRENPMVERYFTHRTSFEQLQPDWLKYVKNRLENEDVVIKEDGNEKIRGVNCRVIRIADKKTGSESVCYVDKDNIMRRWIYSGNDAGSKKVTYDVLEASFDKPIPAERFEVPQGYQITDMSRMMQMQGYPK